jgi:hypothetical protein
MTQAIIDVAGRWHRRARPHHCRQRRPREPEGAQADLSFRNGRLIGRIKK